MIKIMMVSMLLIMPTAVFSATYFNNTSHLLTMSKKSDCSLPDADCVCSENESCTKSELIQILPQESIVFENDQDQPVIIMSKDLHEKREFFPTNNAFNYEITVAKYPSKFLRLTINRAQ